MATMHSTTSGTQNEIIGHVVQHHEIVRLLGAGGMGAVYVARHQALGTLRALKIIRDDIKAQPTMGERFKREALALARLQHPNIVAVVDYGQLENGWPYLMLEFVTGADLAKLLRPSKPLSLPAALVILAQLARTIEFTHAQGIVHRDLKPGNVLLGKNDPRQVKVIDFGLVRLLSAELLTRLTADRQVMGSPQFMAPEQARGSGDITGAADVYAVAGIAYALLSGKSVFGRRPPLALIFAQAREMPTRLSSRVAIPDRLDDLLYASLAKNPADRPTAADMAGAFEHVLADIGGAPADLAPLAPADARDPSGPADESFTNVMGNELASVAGSFVGGRAHDRAASVPDVILSNSMARSVDVASAADIIFAPLPHGDDRRVREALQRQMLAVVGELAEILAPRDAEIATLRTRIVDIEDKLSDLEMDAALIDADLADAGDEQRIELARRKTEIATRINQLRTGVDADQRALAVFIDDRRPSAPPETGALYDELDRMVERALSLPSAAEEPRHDS